PEASLLPSLLKETTKADTVGPLLSLKRWWCAATSQSMTLLSRLPETSVRPSGLKATLVTASACALSGESSGRWDVTSQRIMLLSKLPEAKIPPSELKLTVKTLSEWPTRDPANFPVTRLQSVTNLSSLPAASVFPSGLK